LKLRSDFDPILNKIGCRHHAAFLPCFPPRIAATSGHREKTPRQATAAVPKSETLNQNVTRLLLWLAWMGRLNKRADAVQILPADRPRAWDPVVEEIFRHFDRVRTQLMGMVELIEGAEARWLVSCAYFAPPSPCVLRKIHQRRRKREKQRAKLRAT
jgi:hypothetical protein